MEQKDLSLGRASLVFGSAVLAVVVTLRLKVGLSLPILSGVAAACLGAWSLGHRWARIQEEMFKGVLDGLPAVAILLLVGMTVGLWIAGGAIPTMIWYGLRWLSPKGLVPAACILTALASVATGTSFGTISTLGLALIGVGEAMGVPLPLLAGAIVSGSYFGDKMSPLSDTTNIAPAVSGATLYEHVSSMVYTTMPALLLSLIGYYFLGRGSTGEFAGASSVSSLTSGLEASFRLGPLTLVPVLVLLVLSVKKVPAVPALGASVVVAGATARVSQGLGIARMAKIAVEGNVSATGNGFLDRLLTRGGLNSMMPTVLLILGATAMGGVLRASGAPDRLVRELLERVKTAGGLVISVIASCYAVLLASGNQMLAIILPGQAFKEAFAARGLHPKVLSRTLEDAGTLGAPLVPWSTASLFILTMLKVSANQYAPYAFLNWLSPLVAIAYALTGKFMFRQNHHSEEGDHDR